MDIFTMVLIIGGLIMFEIISSIDNAVINAEVLRTMSSKARRWFLTWGIFFAVVLMRGLLPFAIVFFTNPSLGISGAFMGALSSDPVVKESIEHSSKYLLLAGGIFLVFLFYNWLFLENKAYGIRGEHFFSRHGVWFYTIVSILLTVIVWLALRKDPYLAFAATIGSSAFFITHGFKAQAEKAEQDLLSKKGNLSDASKILYLEVIDGIFSIDGVIGAFAFTTVVPLIILGNGIGAIVLRQITVSNIERIKKYRYLKNGAMYSVFVLGVVMIAHAFGAHVPEWFSPLMTLLVIGYFYWRSARRLRYRSAHNLGE